jgi:hypothetical protein
MSLPGVPINPEHAAPTNEPSIPNGAAAAAILAAGVGCLSVSVCAWLGDAIPTIAHLFNWYPPTGPLSGVSTTAITLWLIVWVTYHRRWKGKTVPMGVIGTISMICMGVGFLLSYPPIGDALQGK